MPTTLDTGLVLVDEVVTVHFNTSAPTLTGFFKGFRNNYQFFIVQDQVDSNIEHLVQDFAYMTSGAVPPPAEVAVDVVVGDSVTVKFERNNQEDVTGTVTATDAALGIVEVDDGVNLIICKDFWKIIKL